MTIEEILKPRTRCINSFPGMQREGFEIGLVFEPEYVDINLHKKYPYLFESLKWYEERPEKDMPEYVKFVYNGKIDECYKVEEWLHVYDNKESDINGFVVKIKDYDYQEKEVCRSSKHSINGWSPATKEEYEDFLKNK
jgi:hypothetical protein